MITKTLLDFWCNLLHLKLISKQNESSEDQIKILTVIFLLRGQDSKAKHKVFINYVRNSMPYALEMVLKM